MAASSARTAGRPGNGMGSKEARRWALYTLVLALAVFVYGVWRAPPVTFVHIEHAEQQSKAQEQPSQTEQEQAPESGQENRPTVLPWLYLLKR